MKKTQLMAVAATMAMLANTCIVHANDAVYLANGNQLVPIHETDISIKKEVLTISLCDDGMARVEVDYEFLNKGKAKTVQMGFEARKPYNTDDALNPAGIHPYIKDFTVVMNGKKLSYRNAVVEPGLLDTPYTGPKDNRPEEEEFEQYSYAYCFDASFSEGINHVRHTYSYQMSYGVGRTFEVPYWLKPAARWQGGVIGDFTLRIRAPKTAKHFVMADSLFAAHEFKVTEGKGKVRHSQYGWSPKLVEVALRDGTVEWHSQNFRPSDDISIESADAFTSFDQNYPVGWFYDRSDRFMVWEREIPDELARNLPYASRGYVFTKKELQKKFEQFWWYIPDPTWKAATDDFTPREWRLIKEKR